MRVKQCATGRVTVLLVIVGVVLVAPSVAQARINSCGPQPHLISNPTITAPNTHVGTMGTGYAGNWDTDRSGTTYTLTWYQAATPTAITGTTVRTVVLTWPNKTDYYTA